jgi:putative transposase
MARAPRPLAPGLTYHVTARGNERQAIARDDADRRFLLARLGEVGVRRGWVVGHFCLMPNHLHLLVRTPEPDLSDGMRELLGHHARCFNDRWDRVGHLFQGRFHTRLVVRDAHHLELHRYLARNPVAAGLCAEPEAYRWSAHAALLGLAPAPRFLDTSLEAFGGSRERYAAFVATGRAFLLDLLGDGSPERLRAARDAGFSQAEIARALGVSQPTIHRRLRE